MTKKEAKELKAGNVVFWNDPDDYYSCSRYYTIKNISIKGDTVSIEDITGDVGDCYLSELSLKIS